MSDCTLARPLEDCLKDYERVRETSQYPPSPTAWRWNPLGNDYETEQACQQYLATRQSLERRVGKLCVVTGVSSTQSPAFCVAQELALTAGMHVVLAGRANLNTCQQAIEAQAKARQIRIKVYTTKFHLASLQSIRQAADFVTHLAQSQYHNQCQILLNMAHVGTSQAKLTDDGLEYNTGSNFVGTQYFTKLLLHLLKETPYSRVVHTNSMGHCLGDNFSPARLVAYPAEGGAPPGFLQQATREHHVHTSLLTPDETIEINQVEVSYTTEQHRQAVYQRGTQVGRSKMALMAATYHMSRLYPQILFFNFHLLPQTRKSWWGGGGNEQLAALPALRAALDDGFDDKRESCADPSSGFCYYLHTDGNPWTPMAPAQDHAFGKACYEACESVLRQLVTADTNTLPFPPKREEHTYGGQTTAYQPPRLTV